jgi:predicted Zn-dependent protease
MNYLINQPLRYSSTQRQPLSSRPVVWLLLIVLVIVGCASIPHTGRRQLNFVSEKQLNALGLEVFDRVTSQEPESKNERLKKMVKRVADRISKAAESMDKPGFKWDVRLIDNDTPNAFCLPGGKIVVFTGILPYVKNEAGLAAVIGHEVAHAVARHGGERLSQQLAMRGALALGAEALKSDKDGKLDTRSRIILGALGVGGKLGIMLPYSRVHEFEGDKIGQIYMAAAGYDPMAAVRVWDRMSKIKKPPIPVWLSTHPADSDRLRKLREFLPDARKYYNEAPAKYGRGAMI